MNKSLKTDSTWEPKRRRPDRPRRNWREREREGSRTIYEITRIDGDWKLESVVDPPTLTHI